MKMKWWLLPFFVILLNFLGSAQTSPYWNPSGSNIYNNNSGNVGINTSSPGTLLDILTASTADGVQLRYSGAAGFVRLTGNNFAATYLNPITMTGDAGLIFGGSAVDSIKTGLVIAPYKSSLSGLRVDKNGNVGIYTNDTKGYQLAVNGSAVFTSAYVKPYGSWPDYVFNKEYSLPTLDSISTYIRQNHHLPDVPSADSIQRSGLDLGGNQALLLKKIEELTLYLIDQHKQFETLKTQNSQLVAENDKLKQECKTLYDHAQASKELIDRVRKLETWVKKQPKQKILGK